MADVVGVWFHSFKTDREPCASCSQSLPRLSRSVDFPPTADEGSEQSRSFASFSEPAGDMNVCYILDGVLILYGIVLTVLYCRLRMRPSSTGSAGHPEKQPAGGGIYAGLSSRTTDTYETIKMDKRPIV